MASIRQGIIKKSDVTATGAQSAEEALLGRALRIPKDNVKVGGRSESEVNPWQAKPLVPRHAAATSNKMYEVRRIDVPLPEPPKPKKEEAPPKEPEPTPEEIEAAWMARIEEARQQAFAEGREAGLAEAKAEYDADLAALKQQFAEDLDAIQHSWDSFMRRSEPQLVQLAFRLARAVLDAPLPDDVRVISERVVAEAVERMATDIAVEVILHPVSYLRVQEAGVEEQLNAIHSKLRWRVDSDLKQNEWIVQSQRAATRRIENELMDQLQRELSGRIDTIGKESGDA